MKEITVTLEKLKSMNVSTWSVKDYSLRGVKTVTLSQLKIGDKVIIDNYFTLITE